MIPVLRARSSVVFDRIKPAGFRLLSALDQATITLGCDLEITSGTDSHSTGRHPEGEAYDVSVLGFSPETIVKLKGTLEQLLGPAFTVLYESRVPPPHPLLVLMTTINPQATGAHIHVQPKKGTTWPPTEDGGVRV